MIGEFSMALADELPALRLSNVTRVGVLRPPAHGLVARMRKRWHAHDESPSSTSCTSPGSAEERANRREDARNLSFVEDVYVNGLAQVAPGRRLVVRTEMVQVWPMQYWQMVEIIMLRRYRSATIRFVDTNERESLARCR